MNLSFFKHIRTKILRGSTFAGIEVCQFNSDYVNSIVFLQRKGDNIVLSEQKKALENIDEIIPFIGHDTPVYLLISLRTILHKVVDSTTNTQDNDALVREVLPNAVAKDFYVQKETIASGILVSVARREVIDALVKLYVEQGLWVVGVSFGSFDVKYVAPLLKDTTSIPTQTHVLSFNKNNQLVDFERNTEGVSSEIALGDDTLDSHLLPAYSAAFKGLLQIPSSVEIPIVTETKQEFFQKSLFQKGAMVALSVLFVSLLLSTFLNYNYKDKLNDLSFQLMNQSGELSALDSLKKQYTQQKQIVEQTNVNQNSRVSFFTDRLAATLPTGLHWIELDIFPMMGNRKEYKDNQLVKFQNDMLVVKGVCNSSIVYNDWIKKLQTVDWIKAAKHIDYKDVNSSLGEFELRIFIKSH